MMRGKWFIPEVGRRWSEAQVPLERVEDSEFQSSLRDFSSTEFVPRAASWAKFQPSLAGLILQPVLRNT